MSSLSGPSIEEAFSSLNLPFEASVENALLIYVGMQFVNAFVVLAIAKRRGFGRERLKQMGAALAFAAVVGPFGPFGFILAAPFWLLAVGSAFLAKPE